MKHFFSFTAFFAVSFLFFLALHIPVMLAQDDESLMTYSPYCGDGTINQDWEQCDGEEGCSQQCQFMEGEGCDDLTLARVVVDTVENEGLGNMTSDIYLGAKTNIIPSGIWFLLHKNGAYVTDPDIDLYEDVPGLAVKRHKKTVQGLIRGEHERGTGSKEHVTGRVEFWNTEATDIRSKGRYRVEKPFNGIKEKRGGEDEIWKEDGVAYFWLTVNPKSDSFHADYERQKGCSVISGYKWNDLNANGELDEPDGEEKISDWEIALVPKGLEPLETLEVDSRNPDGEITTTILESGRKYLIEVKGKYVYKEEEGNENQADAEYFTSNKWDTYEDGTSETGDTLDLLIDNENIDWGSYNEKHAYKKIVEGGDEPLIFQIFDPDLYDDNKRSIKVTLSDVTDYIVMTNEDGYYEKMLQRGKYIVLEVQQDGWKQTAPDNGGYCVVKNGEGGGVCNFGNYKIEEPEPEIPPFGEGADFADVTDHEVIVLESGLDMVVAKDQVLIYLAADTPFSELEVLLESIEELEGEIIGSRRNSRTLQVSIPSSASEIDFINEIKLLSGVADAGFNMAVMVLDENGNKNEEGFHRYLEKKEGEIVPMPLMSTQNMSLLEEVSSPDFDGNYWIEHIQAHKAWEITNGSDDERSVIGIVDTGIKSDQEIVEEGRLQRYDSSGNPFFSDPKTQDVDHGWWVLGLSAGFEDNEDVMSRGMAWENSVITVDVSDKITGDCTVEINGFEFFCHYLIYYTDVSKSIETAIDKGADVVNVSLGTSGIECDFPTEIKKEAAQEFRKSQTSILSSKAKGDGSLVVFAAGNNCEKNDDELLPEDSLLDESVWETHVLRVGASNDEQEDTVFSDMGDTVGILAPGENISFYKKMREGWFPSLFNEVIGGPTKESGTSLSASLVTGTVALVKGVNPSLTAPEIRGLILNSSTPILTGYTPNKLLNAFGAVNEASALPRTIETYPTVFFSPDDDDIQVVEIFADIEEGKPFDNMDVVFLIDTTGSYGDDIDSLQSKADEIIDNLSGRGINVQFGVSSFADFPFSPYGDNIHGDEAFYLNQAITGDIELVKTAIDNLDNPLHSGADFPESQLEALYQVSTGNGKNLNPSEDDDYDDLGELKPVNIGWRTGAAKIVILATDAMFHKSEDPFSSYPGASTSEAIEALQNNGITVIGLDSGHTNGDLEEITDATNGALFALSSDSSEIAEVIIQAIDEQLQEVDVSYEVVSGGEWIESVEPEEYLDVVPPTTERFTVNIKRGKRNGIFDQHYHVYLWVKVDNSAVIKRVHIPIVIPKQDYEL
jgi:subtilisin family serine protease